MGLIHNIRVKGFTILRSRFYKKFMARMYGWGASVVILGALFKINHYPYADEFLLVGLSVEALIFFLSAFEAPHVEPDWSIVYPELIEFYHGDGIGKINEIRRPTQQLDALLKNANIDEKIISRLGEGLNKLGDTTSQLGDLTNAAVASNNYAENIQAATESATDLNNAYKKTSESLYHSAEASQQHSEKLGEAAKNSAELAGVYRDTSEALKSELNATTEFSEHIKSASKSAKELADKYKASTEKIVQSADALDFSGIEGNSYNEELRKISDTLSSLNNLYQKQLESSNQQIESSVQLQETMNNFLANLMDSADKMITYKHNMDQLNEKMAALNEVYSNMLNAMTVKK